MNRAYKTLLRTFDRGRALVYAAPYWLQALSHGSAPSRGIHVSCGIPDVPGRSDEAHGGMIRYQRMQEEFPNRPYDYNILYLASSTLPPDWRQQVWIAEKKGAAFVWNQNGVAYPGWAEADVESANQPLREGLQTAEHVVYQSDFCKRSADIWLGEPEGSWTVVHNAVDTDRFTPSSSPSPRDGLTLLLGGHQYERYRLMSALETFAKVRKRRPDAELVVTGRVHWPDDGDRCLEIARDRARELGISDGVTWRGVYTQEEAPEIYRNADILLHTKYKDPCPSVVIEALSAGVPVAYSDSGGVPELVGPNAGIGVDVEDTWDRQVPPDPAELAEATLTLAEDLERYSKAARQQAVENLDLSSWIEEHERIFGGLVEELGN